MKRSSLLLASCCAAALCLWVDNARGHNENFNFNSSAEGWTFDTLPSVSGTATPYWNWYGPPSSSAAALQAWTLGSGSAVLGAWALSPCLDILQESGTQRYIHMDFSHFTQLPQGAFGQVQFQIDVTGTSGFGAWKGIPSSAWITTNHVVPTTGTAGLSPEPPLVNSSGYPPNDWLAFSGTITASTNPGAKASGSGPHVLSAFTLPWDDYGLSNGSEIQFRFVVAVDSTYQPPSPDQILWEVNDVTIDGAKVCAVPEPGTLALAGVALACGLGGYSRRRRRQHPVARQPDHGVGQRGHGEFVP